jgi:peptidoglycan hydrolase-like protein with peptidoglycan-binding domain
MRRLATWVGLVVLVGAAAFAGWALRSANQTEPVSVETVPTEEVAVVVTDLVQFDTLNGTLGYEGERVVRTALAGTVTGLPEEATRLERGSVAYEIDGQPVIVFVGDRPAWRPLNDDIDDGADVLQLEQNLAALGFGPDDWEPDSEFNRTTANAVEAWREEVGLPEDDSLELGRILFLPEPLRVGAIDVSVGQPVTAGMSMYRATTFDQEVLIELDPDDLDLVSEGAEVSVTLPDGREVAGLIEDVGRVVRSVGPDPDAEGVIEVIVALGETVLDIDQAPVDVDIETDRAAGVLAVPVRALISLSDGGYAVEVDGRLIGVETGDFAGGLVEVTGALSEGDLVVVPR